MNLNRCGLKHIKSHQELWPSEGRHLDGRKTILSTPSFLQSQERWKALKAELVLEPLHFLKVVKEPPPRPQLSLSLDIQVLTVHLKL